MFLSYFTLAFVTSLEPVYHLLSCKPAFRKGASIILFNYIVVKLHQATFYSILSNTAFLLLFFLRFGCTGSLIRCGNFSCSGAWAQLLCSMWVLVPQSGIEPTYPTLESRFLTTGTPGKYQHFFFFNYLWNHSFQF